MRLNNMAKSRDIFYNEGGGTLDQVAQRSCGSSVLEMFYDSVIMVTVVAYHKLQVSLGPRSSHRLAAQLYV